MRIAILGWGSLISEPRGLPIIGEWQKDGPMLWVEFSRISKRGARAGCLTLVIDERSDEEIRTFYVISARTDLAQAIADLQSREGTPPDDIGFCEVASGHFAPNALNRHPKSCERISTWAQKKGFNAVIWTALPRRFQDAIGIPFSPAAALRYVNGFPPAVPRRSFRYGSVPAVSPPPLHFPVRRTAGRSHEQKNYRDFTRNIQTCDRQLS